MSSASDPKAPDETSALDAHAVTDDASTPPTSSGDPVPPSNDAPEDAESATGGAQPAAPVLTQPAPEATQRQRLMMVLRRQFRGVLTGETPLWLLVALGLGAFLNLVTFAFLVSPINRGNLLNPPVKEMEEMGMSATDIADRLNYASQITPTMLNVGAAIAFCSMLALAFTLFWRKRLGIYIYIVLTGIMLVATLMNGMFTPVLLLVPTAVVVTAAVNRELLT